MARAKTWFRGRQAKRDVGKFDCRGNKEQWPATRPKYLRFLLYKENTDTVGFSSPSWHVLGCNTKVFSYAGTKDKRAVTVQAVTAYHVTENDTLKVNRRVGVMVCLCVN